MIDKSNFAEISKALLTAKFFFYVVVAAIALSWAFNLDQFILNAFFDTRDFISVVNPAFQHYNILFFALFAGFLAYLCYGIMKLFFMATFSSHIDGKGRVIQFNDVYELKYKDLPPIPYESNVMSFMNEADAFYQNGKGRYAEATLNNNGIDKYGNYY